LDGLGVKRYRNEEVFEIVHGRNPLPIIIIILLNVSNDPLSGTVDWCEGAASSETSRLTCNNSPPSVKSTLWRSKNDAG